MSGRDDGGPAFPTQEWNADGTPATLMLGMTLRDYFAAKAMQAGIGRWGGGGGMFDEGGCSHSKLCEESYQIADAMLRARRQS